VIYELDMRNEKMTKIFAFLLFFIFTALSLPLAQGAEPQFYLIEEGIGIQSLVSIGESVEVVYRRWGKPERVAKEDYITDTFNEYHRRGVLITSDKDGKIKSMTFYCNTGNKEQLHKTGLAWINPSSVYATFSGRTRKGLILKEKLTPQDVYRIYGKPKITYELGKVDNIREIQKRGKPFIYSMGKAGYSIQYPKQRVSFSVYSDLVESMSICGTE